MEKQKPTKVTKDDIELAEELSRITTIKELIDQFFGTVTTQFAELTEVAYTGNPVAMYIEINQKRNILESATLDLQTTLLQILGQVGEDDAQVIAQANLEDESIPEVVPASIDEALLGAHDDAPKSEDELEEKE